MTKTWNAILAVALGLSGATLCAAEPPEKLTQPPTELKVAPLPLDTKTPLNAPAPAVNGSAPNFWPTPDPTPAANPPAPTSAPAAPCASGSACGGCATKTYLCLGLGSHDHPGLAKFWDWLTYRPCHLTPCSCCEWPARPMPDGYEYFLWLHCVEGSCGSCCKTGCNGCGK
jgi:hypothetical protein